MTPTLDKALCNSRAGTDLGYESGLVEELCQLGFSSFPEVDTSLKGRQGDAL